ILSGLIRKYKEINDFYTSSTKDYIDATFLKNHDQNRIMSELGNDLSKAKVAAGILLTLPGTPYIYYGEEIGMQGLKPDEYIREPFIWDDAKKINSAQPGKRQSTVRMQRFNPRQSQRKIPLPCIIIT
ncbi:MAG: hypothetical protein IPK96_12450, partial [Flammeovirgaceae bacterium]|nr:hypothetical protein [Flammeovirgaceae bacterium]